MPAQGRNTPQPTGGASRPPLVAVVEDDPSFRRALSRSLVLRGFRSEVFASAEEFLQHAYSQQADCVVLDIHLGGMSGFELQSELAKRPSYPPIIFITAFDEPATRERALEVVAAGYLQKPFDEASLLQAIERAGFAPSGPLRPT